MRHHKAWGVPGLPWTPRNAAENVVLKPERMSQPLSWRKPRMIFVNSMSDLFHEEIPNDYIAQVFGVMAQCPQHTFQVLTKRPERMRDKILVHWGGWDPPPNIWWGTSIENRRYVSRADVLRDTPAAIRFISAEPLLGPLTVPRTSRPDRDRYPADYREALSLWKIDWLIVGGESGVGHRPMDLDWVRDLRGDCLSSDDPGQRTAFFLKQIGGRTPKAGGRELDGRTWDEMPTPVAEPASAAALF